jgi:hypothetical protein
VIPEMADTVGVSRSTVNRENVEASESFTPPEFTRRVCDTSDLRTALLIWA